MRLLGFSLTFLFCLVSIPLMAQNAAETKVDNAGNIVFFVKGREAVRFAPQDGLCTSQSSGAVRYNSTTHVFEGCNCANCGTSTESWSWGPLVEPPRTWVDATSERSFYQTCNQCAPGGFDIVNEYRSSIYYNGTGSEIIVSLYTDFFGYYSRIQAWVDGKIVNENADSYPGGAVSSTVSFSVPAGARYGFYAFYGPADQMVTSRGGSYAGGTPGFGLGFRWMEYRANNNITRVTP